MGIYTEYGRFVKARQFKEWCNAGAGIWFGFGIGSPEWDNIITDNSITDSRDRPNTPPSSPNLYSPLYRWFTSYKEDQGDTPPATLAPQELSLIDRSYWGIVDGSWPDNNTIINNPSTPTDSYAPSLGFYSSDTPEFFHYTNRKEDDYTLLFPQVPVFPQAYENDWVGDGKPIDVYQSTSSFDPDVEPNDSSQYESFAYNYHIYYSGSNYSNSLFGAPLGFMSFIQGSAHFVIPLEDGEVDSPIDNIRRFKYGNHYWRVLQDSDIESSMGDIHLPHHILLTVSVFPNDIARSSLVEMQLPIRQVSVFKFPDSLITPLGLDVSPLPRGNQVIRRDSLNMVYHQLNNDNSITPSPDDPSSQRKGIPFHAFTPMNPNNSEAPTIEMIINDFMTARRRDVQQTDRYGYIIGF